MAELDLDYKRQLREMNEALLVSSVRQHELTEEALHGAQAMRENERHLHDLIEALPAAVYTTDAEGRITMFNQAAVELAGRIPKVGSDCWCVSWKLYRADGTPLPHDECPMAIALKKRRSIRGCEMIAERPDGTRAYVVAYPTPLFDESGKLIGAVNMLVDITERKRSEQAIERLAAIVEFSDDAIVTKDLNGVIVSWNQGAERLFGYTAQEAIGQSIAMLLPPGRQSEEAGVLARIRQGRHIDHFETVRRRKNGSLVEISLSVSPLRNAQGDIIGASKIARDITERKHAESLQVQLAERLGYELQATKRLQGTSTRMIQGGNVSALFKEILDAAIDLMRSDMASMQMVDISKDALRLLEWRGFGPEFAHTFALTNSETRTSCSAAWRSGNRVIVPDVETCDFIVGTPALEDHRKNGIRSVQSTPLISRGGSILGVISTHWRTPHEPPVRELRLLDVLARQAADLIERVQLEEESDLASRRKTEFLGMLAHELRNPLAPIRNALQIMRMSQSDPDAIRTLSDMMERQVGQMARLVDDLLDVGRISQGKIELRRGCIELASVVHHAVEAGSPSIDSAQQKLTLRLPPEPIYVNGDPVRLTQIVGNLLNNASKFTADGGSIVLTVEREGNQAVLRVWDNGLGIAADQLARIFDMFAQIDTSTGRSGGLGIGLALVKKLVAMHGGTVEVQSAGIGQGSEFTVRLPIVAEIPKSPPAQSPVCGTEPVVGCRILVVDDNRDSAISLGMLLELSGNATRTAYDGLEAVEAAEAFKPEVVVLDIGLPKLDGYQVARKIREQAWGKDIVLVALTGWGQDEDREKTREAGFDGHLLKPVDHAALMNLLADRLRAAP